MEDLPKIQLTVDEADAGVPLIDLYVKLGFATSKSEARKLMQVSSLSARKGNVIGFLGCRGCRVWDSCAWYCLVKGLGFRV